MFRPPLAPAQRSASSDFLAHAELQSSRCPEFFAGVQVACPLHGHCVGHERVALAEHFGRFTLEPTGKAGSRSYFAHCEIDFFWGRDGANGWCRGPGLHHAYHGVQFLTSQMTRRRTVAGARHHPNLLVLPFTKFRTWVRFPSPAPLTYFSIHHLTKQ